MFGAKKATKPSESAAEIVDSSSKDLMSNPEKISAILNAFPAKMSQTSGKVPFTEQITAVYYAIRDPSTSLRVKATLAAALAYFILPTDLIPDFVAAFGYTDDFAVLMLVLKRLGPAVKPEHYELARRRLQRDK